MKTVSIAVAVLAGMLACMGARGQAATEGQQPHVSIEVGMLSLSFIRGSEAWFAGEIAAFERAHPDIDVTTLAIATPNKRERNIINMPALARNVVGVNSLLGGEAAWLASRGQIVPIEKFQPDAELPLDTFPASLFEAVTFGGKTWAIPWCTEHVVFACNWPLFEKEGLTRPPETWEEFTAYAQRFTKDTNGDGKTDQWGVCVPSFDIFGFVAMTLMMQKDGRVYNKTGIDLSHPSFPESIGMIAQWMEAGIASEDLNAGMWFGKKEHIQVLSQDFKFAPMPTWGRKVMCNNETDYLAIRKSTDEEEKASWEFVKWMSRKDVSMPPEWAGYPCRADFAERDDFKAISNNYGGTLSLIYTGNALAHDSGPANFINWQNALAHVMGFLRQAMAGEGSYDSLMTTATQEANKLIEVIPDPADMAVNLYK